MPLELMVRALNWDTQRLIENQHKEYIVLPEGLSQLSEYMDRVDENRGWLVIFDRDAATPWEEKIYMRTETVDGKEITLAGC